MSKNREAQRAKRMVDKSLEEAEVSFELPEVTEKEVKDAKEELEELEETE